MFQYVDVVGITQAARLLGIHPNSLRRAEREGRVPAAKRESFSRIRIYTRVDIEALRRHLWLRRRGRSHLGPNSKTRVSALI